MGPWLTDTVQFSLPCAQMCLFHVTEWPLQPSFTLNAHPASPPLPTWALLPGVPLCVPHPHPRGIFLTLHRLHKSETKAHPPLAVGPDTPAIPAGHLEHRQITPRPAPRQAWGVCPLSGG